MSYEMPFDTLPPYTYVIKLQDFALSFPYSHSPPIPSSPLPTPTPILIPLSSPFPSPPLLSSPLYSYFCLQKKKTCRPLIRP